ncbi:DNA phosphorothioation-dependent restriction protein DptF, partial [Brochothrix thermosphacta]
GNSELSDDKNYFHVERPIEIDLIERLEKIKQLSKPQVLFLCGNVGDGKSHLLSYIKTNRPDLLENTDIHNDATESFSPEETALDTLYNVLGKFKDDVDERANSKKHLIIAINMGVLHKFIYDEKIRKDYRDICN